MDEYSQSATTATVLLVAITAGLFVYLIAAFRHLGVPRVATGGLVLVGWLGLATIASVTGLISDFDAIPPRFPIFPLLFLIGGITWVVRNRAHLQSLDPEHLIAPQAYRIFVEVMLWLSFLGHLLPKQITLEGYNFDVVVGLAALPVAWYVQRRKQGWRGVAIGFNVVGILVLLTVIALVVLSLPIPIRQFTNEPSTAIVLTFPWIWLPAFIAPLALVVHAASLVNLMGWQAKAEQY